MDALWQWLGDYWLLTGLILAGIFMLYFLIRHLYRLFAFAAVAGVILVLVFHYTPEQVIHMGRSMVQETNDALASSLYPMLEKELSGASYHFHEDGTYEIRTANLRIVGKKGDPQATVFYKGKSYQLDISPFAEWLQKEEVQRTNTL